MRFISTPPLIHNWSTCSNTDNNNIRHTSCWVNFYIIYNEVAGSQTERIVSLSLVSHGSQGWQIFYPSRVSTVLQLTNYLNKSVFLKRSWQHCTDMEWEWFWQEIEMKIGDIFINIRLYLFLLQIRKDNAKSWTRYKSFSMFY